MELIQFRRAYSRSVLLQMLLSAIVVGLLIAWQYGKIKDIYLTNQLSDVGIIINGLILVLFLLGMFRIVVALAGYAREEKALRTFIDNMQDDPDDPLQGMNTKNMISTRYMMMQRLYESRTPINQGALAATLVANESTRINLPRFINNVLILTGVFGTIVSLSIALIGASSMFEGSVDSSGMGLVIHGMSTALSTTMTAIACYLFFGYFYLKLTNVQTNLVSGIEQVTTAYLSPKFQVTNESIVHELSGLLRLLQELTKKMDHSQKQFGAMEHAMAQAVISFKTQTDSFPPHMDELKTILRHGFRIEHEKENDE
ncbi:MAG: hypothetical protein U9Q75_10550 [Pseudomonadota bacterium]|nr:hypothetical protein [Pseudomonadota bacterium]